jgi:hypothetical protein
MAESFRRLLAAFSLIFVSLTLFSLIFAAPVLLCGQTPKLWSPNFSVPIEPDRIPLSPNLPLGYPWTPSTGVSQRLVFQQLVFQQLVRAAGIIFSGRVTSIGHAASSSHPHPASTTVTFQVEYAMRGTSPGRRLTIREWAGLWTSGEPYRVGERVLLFLYSPGKLGLTSPVAGAMGRFAMDSHGQVVLSAMHVATLAADPILGRKILGGKTVVPYADFALAVHRASRGDE